MRVRLLTDAAEFLSATLALRTADPLRTNVLGSVAEMVLAGRRFERELWLVAEDDGAVVGAAMWTPPHKLVVSPTTRETARAIGAAAVDAGGQVPGVVAPVEVVDAVVEGTGESVVSSRPERLLVLGDLVPPRPVRGTARAIRDADVDEATRWREAFAREIGALAAGSRDAVLASMGRQWFWDVDGTPVSMAGHAPLVTTPAGVVGRIGPVFTPVEHRGRGYAAAVTAAVAERLLGTCDVVMLYTDASNATSNGVYERLGFVHVADVVEVVLTPR